MDELSDRHEAPTISQVAEAAGVSRATVSRAFTRPDMLSADTVRRVMEIAEKIGYVPNHTASPCRRILASSAATTCSTR